jgi:hypothetical protein
LILLLVLAVLSTEATAQGKAISGTAKFGPMMSQTLLLPGDAPKHEVTLVSRAQTWNSSDPDWNNVAVTQFVFSDYIAGQGSHRGHNVNVHPSGDRTFISYEGQTTRTSKPDGSWEAKFEGKMRFTGGTGKFQGITGNGAYIGMASAPSGPTATNATFEWNAEYSLPK